jgi:hypothetical protein
VRVFERPVGAADRRRYYREIAAILNDKNDITAMKDARLHLR